MALASPTAELVAELEAEVLSKTPGSVALQNRGAAVMPGGASGDGKTWWPIYFSRAHGARVHDVDGREYIDLVLGIGPNVLGDTDDNISGAVAQIFAALGGAVAAGTELEVELAERINQAIPAMERVRFVSTVWRPR